MIAKATNLLLDKENGYRQYNTAYVEIPKKNGKSELAAGGKISTMTMDSNCIRGKGNMGQEIPLCHKQLGKQLGRPEFILPVFR